MVDEIRRIGATELACKQQGDIGVAERVEMQDGERATGRNL
ncbi:hypothetical protein [Accumulibacter sp.]|nr:hypothetical protein [Accumulibacter sp.]